MVTFNSYVKLPEGKCIQIDKYVYLIYLIQIMHVYTLITL